MPQYESPFEENLYQLRREKLGQIAALARAVNPELSESEARYPNSFAVSASVPELRALGEHLTSEDLEPMHLQAAVAGRIVAIRVQGKAGFAQIQQHGQRLQIYVRKDDVGSSPEQSQALFSIYKLLDLGDHIGVRGYLMRTRTGELTLHVAPITLPGHEGRPAIHFLSKAMLALPDKFHGLEDIELRYRRRYLDLFSDTGDTAEPILEAKPAAEQEPAAQSLSTAVPILTRLPAREVFLKRAHILRSIRHYFDTHGYLEVETPMLHTVAGGAAARPFTTHHNALDMRLNLRIAPELYLKRLVVGGFDRVYEINRNFRNEGVSTQHNPEFTMLEFYQAYANYKDLMQLTKNLIAQVAVDVNGTTITNFNGTEIDLAPEKWKEISMREAILEFWPPEFAPPPSMLDFSSRESFRAFLSSTFKRVRRQYPEIETQNATGVDPERHSYLRSVWTAFNATCALLDTVRTRHGQATSVAMGFPVTHATELAEPEPVGKAIADVFEVIAEKYLIQPTIIYDYPLAVSPLSKIKPNEPDWVERFEFYIGGFELGNGFSELNDPDDQQRRFEAQIEDRKRGDVEAMAEVDDDYVRALGYGLPPTAGEGIGIDRLTMILTGSRSIRDVILFPLMRPQKQAPEDTDPQHIHDESAE